MLIGLTGGIGSGKSTIARALAARGYAVYDCDREAKRIIAENPAVQQQIIALFGEEAFIDGRYNTAYVSQRVFTDPELLTRLNAIIHPAVMEDIRYKKPDFVESAILYESGFDTLCDKIIVIDAPEEVRIARTISRDYQGQATLENINKVRARIRTQNTVHRTLYTRHPTPYTLTNDGSASIDDLADKILNWLQK